MADKKYVDGKKIATKAKEYVGRIVFGTSGTVALNKGNLLDDYKSIALLSSPDAQIISSYYNWRTKSQYRSQEGFHYGYDIALPYGSKVYSGWSGIITAITAWTNTQYGVTVETGDYQMTYGHIINIAVSLNQVVTPGTLLGYTEIDHVDIKSKIVASNSYFDFGASSDWGKVTTTSTNRNACTYAVRCIIASADYTKLSRLVTKSPIDKQSTAMGLANSYFGDDCGTCLRYPGISASESDFSEGDLIFYHTGTLWSIGVVTHVGIYVGNSQVIATTLNSNPPQIAYNAWNYCTILGSCRLFDESTQGLPTSTDPSSIDTLESVFKVINTGDYSKSVGYQGSNSNTPQDAQNQADAKAAQDAKKVYAQANAIGDYRLRIKLKAVVRGVGERMSGTYYIKSSRHILNRDSYKTSVTLSRDSLENNTEHEEIRSAVNYNNNNNNNNSNNNTDTYNFDANGNYGQTSNHEWMR